MINYEAHYTAVQQELAKEIIGLERAALDKWFKGDTSGYRELWSKRNFTYFDSIMDHRVDTYEEIGRLFSL